MKNFKQPGRIALVTMASMVAALSLSACGTNGTASNIDIESEEMAEAATSVVAEGYVPLAGTSLIQALSGQTFSYRDHEEETNVSVTYFDNGLASITWVDEDAERGMTEKLWTIEEGQYLCLWNKNDNVDDDCTRVLTKSGQLATVDNDGVVAYYTQS